MTTPELFLVAMRERHGVSDDFIEAARPLVEAIFAEFDGEKRHDLLEFAESVFSQQAETERMVRSCTHSIREAARKLEQSFTRVTLALETLRKSRSEVVALGATPVPRWRMN